MREGRSSAGLWDAISGKSACSNCMRQVCICALQASIHLQTYWKTENSSVMNLIFITIPGHKQNMSHCIFCPSKNVAHASCMPLMQSSCVQDDPEGFVRSADLEASPDADTPRACGVALLLCLLERGGQTVSSAMLSLASRLQVGVVEGVSESESACGRKKGVRVGGKRVCVGVCEGGVWVCAYVCACACVDLCVGTCTCVSKAAPPLSGLPHHGGIACCGREAAWQIKRGTAHAQGVRRPCHAVAFHRDWVTCQARLHACFPGLHMHAPAHHLRSLLPLLQPHAGPPSPTFTGLPTSPHPSCACGGRHTAPLHRTTA